MRGGAGLTGRPSWFLIVLTGAGNSVPVPRTVVIVGTSGVGKSHLAEKVATILDVPVVELDAFKHGPGWRRFDPATVRAAIAAATTGECWVADGNWDEAPTLLWPRADLIVWLDYPGWVVMQRVIRRSILRTALRRKLWNGNRETIRDWFDLTHPVYLALRTMRRRRRAYAACQDCCWLRLHSPTQARRWLASLAREAATTDTRTVSTHQEDDHVARDLVDG